MNQKIRKYDFNKLLFSIFTLTFLVIIISTQNIQTSSHYHQINTPILIYANQQSIDMLTNTLTFTGNVVIQKNSINIYADTIIIKHLNQKKNKHIITAYGNPVILYYLKNHTNQTLITSSYLLYNEIDHIIILRGQAFLKMKNNTLQSNCIIYMIKNKYIETCNQNNDITKTTIIINDKKK